MRLVQMGTRLCRFEVMRLVQMGTQMYRLLKRHRLIEGVLY
jgi:hypothetical protein